MKSAWGSLSEYFLPVIDVLLPERARAARIRRRRLDDFEIQPTEHELLGQSIVTLLDYKNHHVSDLVRALKYEHSGKAAHLAASVLADYLAEEIAALKAFSARPIVLVPMPLHVSRVRERGFNQMHKIFWNLPHEFKDGSVSRIEIDALVRVKPTPQQARLNRTERLRNVADAFAPGHQNLRNTHIILIDDVTTTGATLASAAKTLRKVGAKVSLLALARA